MKRKWQSSTVKELNKGAVRRDGDNRSSWTLIRIIVLMLVVTWFAGNDAAALDLTEADCRSCHCNNVADRHHILVVQGGYECLSCHDLIWDNAAEEYHAGLIRDCLLCHGPSLADRHHLLVAAGVQQCLNCHQLVLDNETDMYVLDLKLGCPDCFFDRDKDGDVDGLDVTGAANDSFRPGELRQLASEFGKSDCGTENSGW